MKLGSRQAKLGSRFAKLGAVVRQAVTVTPTGPFHGSRARIHFTIAGVVEDASIVLRAVKVNRATNTLGVSAYDDEDAEYVTGEGESSLEFEGFFDADLDLSEHIDALTAFDYYPHGTATGSHILTGTGTMIADLHIEGSLDKATSIAGTLAVDGDLERGVV